MVPHCSDGLCHLTDSQKAAAKRFSLPRDPIPATEAPVLKRCLGYFEEQLSTTRAKLDVMQVDELSTEEGPVPIQEFDVNIVSTASLK